MDLKEAKRLISYARKQGIRAITMDGLAVEFFESAMKPVMRKPRLVPSALDATLPKGIPEPTLDQINEYIYGKTEEAG